MIRIRIAIQWLLAMASHLFQHTLDPNPSMAEQSYLCSAAPLCAEAMRNQRPNGRETVEDMTVPSSRV